jgi:integrase
LIPYRAMLDVPAELLRYLSRLLAAERRRRGTPARSRKLTCRDQALLALRWFRDRTRPGRLAIDHGISRATAYRYVGEAVDVLSAQAPGLDEALQRALGLARHQKPGKAAEHRPADDLVRRAEQAGYTGLTPHQFRHTFSDDWLRSGGSEGDLMRLNGWKSRAMVDRYADDVANQRALEAKRRKGDTF